MVEFEILSDDGEMDFFPAHKDEREIKEIMERGIDLNSNNHYSVVDAGKGNAVLHASPNSSVIASNVGLAKVIAAGTFYRDEQGKLVVVHQQVKGIDDSVHASATRAVADGLLAHFPGVLNGVVYTKSVAYN
jgi:hypothetical protein